MRRLAAAALLAAFLGGALGCDSERKDKVPKDKEVAPMPKNTDKKSGPKM